MKKNITIITIISLILLTAMEAYSAKEGILGSSSGSFEKVGAAGAQYLKIGVGGRANAMAGAASAISDDLSTLFWNPAGLSDLKGINAYFAYTQWFGGFSHNFASASMELNENFKVGASIISFNSQEMKYTTVAQPDGTGANFSENDIAMGLTLAGVLTDQFSFGITAKYISNAIGNLSSNGIAFDIGTRYNTGIYGIILGFSLHNLGSEQQYDGQDLRGSSKINNALYAAPLDMSYVANSYTIPLTFRAGIAGDIIKEGEHHLLAAFDFMALSDVPEQYAIGAEYTWNEIISGRVGWRFGQYQDGFSAGIGLKYLSGGFGGKLDYSISPTYSLGLVNRLSASVSFN
ncbi:MAG: hypothetical protein QG635_1268 [Bacteroidota bacterium]|nr:hypothetical protein [Bacteroidota bacterium]